MTTVKTKRMKNWLDIIVTRMIPHPQSHRRSQERDPSGEEDQVLCCSSKVPAGGPVHFGQVQILVKFKFWSSSNLDFDQIKLCLYSSHL